MNEELHTRWPVPGLIEASQAIAPEPLPFAEYADLLLPAWQDLLDSDESRDEATVQDFLERHPCLLPGAFSVDGDSGHAPWPAAVIAQPMLPAMSTKRPDFLWIATDSESIYPILIEIETPHSRWWHSKGAELHSDFSHARGQLTEWQAWFADPLNEIAFANHYQLPAVMRRRTLKPRYVLIHGRRDQTQEDVAKIKKRGQIARPDERIMTFDRLTINAKSSDLVCVKPTASSYELKYAPPTFRTINWSDERYAAITEWAVGLGKSPEMAAARAERIRVDVEALRKTFLKGERQPLRLAIQS